MASGTATSEYRGATSDLSRTLLVRLGLAATTCLAVALLSSWYRSRLPIGSRLAELTLAVLIWEGSVSVCAALLRRRFGQFAGSSQLLAISVAAASLPATAGLLAVFRCVGEHSGPPLALYGQSLLLGLILAFARRGLIRGGLAPVAASVAEAVADHTVSPETTGQIFLRRYAPCLAGHRLLALEAEDHYLRLHTDGGSVLVLMRLRDAMAELGPSAGWQAHRSFWVASGVPARAERSGHGWTLSLPGGLVVPVSRSRATGLREAATRSAQKHS
ncbi:MAG: LytTR family DNA-binding domain-containing protein [Janthinobacterium lividum]